MAIDFPNSPAVDEIYSVGDKSWLWNGTYWEVQGSPTSTFSASDTAPSSPSAGDIWYRSDTSQTLIYYDSTWVEIGHSANIANFLADADADTKIQLEESSDEDTIRFDIAGSEKMALNASSLTVYDSLSVGSGASASSFDASGSGANLMPSGTTAERPASPTAGMFRFNETTGEPEWYSSANSQWVKFRSGPAMLMSYLVVAGGAGGGNNHGGGGGAGGLLTGTGNIAEPSVSYTVTVGAGGVGGQTEGAVGSNGNDSVFASYTSSGGGGGGGRISNDNVSTAASGGSGGGGAGTEDGADPSPPGGSGTAGQGNDGGDGYSGPIAGNGGGGGGAGAAGASASTSSTSENAGAAGDGGAGQTSTLITTSQASTYSIGEVVGSDVYFSGGGGGGIWGTTATVGAGGNGGGGNGNVNYTAGSSGTANTGGGGGGGGGGSAGGGSGGSGVVVLRYQTSGGTASISAGLTYNSITDGSDTILIFTAGTGTVSWA